MSVGTLPAPPPPARPAVVPEDRLHRLSLEQYQRMIRTGILTATDRVELLEGFIVTKMSKNPPHIFAARRLFRFLDRALPAGWIVFKEDPVVTARSMPEPDCVVIRGSDDDYRNRHPGAHDVALVVEVADTSLHDDRNLKKRIYAEAAVAIYWILNIPERRIEVYTEPSGPGDRPDFRQRQDYGETEAVPLMIDGREVGRAAVADFLP